MPESQNREHLGKHSNCGSAVKEAKSEDTMQMVAIIVVDHAILVNFIKNIA